MVLRGQPPELSATQSLCNTEAGSRMLELGGAGDPWGRRGGGVAGAWQALLKGVNIQSERKETMVDGDVATQQRCDYAYPIYYT